MHRDWPKMDPENQRYVLIAYDEIPSRLRQIYIGVLLPENLEDCIQLFESLANGSQDSIDLADPARVWLENLDELNLRVAPKGRGRVRVQKDRGRISCDWECSAEEWKDAADLLRAMRLGPGFQYLTPARFSDDAEIEFDFAGPPIRLKP
jgi:hypothetical protein